MGRSGGKRKWIAGIGAAAAVAALLYVAAVPRPVKVELADVKRGSVVETVRADGILRSKDRYIVPAFADGDIKRVVPKVGDRMKKGQPVTELFWNNRYEPVPSPIEGVISKVFRESAGPIKRGEPIVEVVDPSRLEVMAELLTTDAARVTAGDPATIQGWGGGGQLAARVSRVSQAGFTKPSALGVEEEKTEVTLELERMPPEILSRLGSGFHVETVIVVARHEGVLAIPVGAIFRDGAGWAVYRERSGRAARAAIELGARGEGSVEVKSGLSEGDRVVVYPGDLVREGTRIGAQGRKTD